MGRGPLEYHVGQLGPAGRETGGHWRRDDAAHAELTGNRHGEQAACAAAGHERGLARVDSLRDCDLADRGHHVLGGDREHACRGLAPVHLQRRGELVKCGLGTRGLELHRAAEEVVRVEVAEHQCRVGHGGLGAPASVAGGSRVSARAARPDAHEAASVHPGDRAAASTDRVDVDAGETGDVSGELGANPALVGEGDLPVAHQADVEARPAGVDHDQVIPGSGSVGACPRASSKRRHRRTAIKRKQRRLDHRAQRQDAARAGRHLRPAAEPQLLETMVELAEVALQKRLQRRVHGGPRRAAVLANDRVDHMGGADRTVGAALLEDRDDALLVLWMGDRPEEANGDRLDIELVEPIGDLLDLRFDERDQHFAVRGNPFGHLEGEIARNVGTRGRLRVVERICPASLLEQEEIAAAPRGHEGGLGRGAFEDRVRGLGGRQHEPLRITQKLRELQVELAGGARESCFDALGHVLRRSRGLRECAEPAVVGNDQVGEGSARVTRDSPRHGLRSFRSSREVRAL